MNDPLDRVVVLGDALYGEGIGEVLTANCFATTVDCEALDQPIADQLASAANLFVICADSHEIPSVDGVIRRLRRRNRGAPIVLMSHLPWEERLDHIGERRINACIDKSVARQQLIAILRLVMDGFAII